MLGFSPLASGPLAATVSTGDAPLAISAEIAVTATASAGLTRPAAATAATAVTATASANRYRTVDPAAPNAPKLHYYCANHSAMGGSTNHAVASTATYVVTVAAGKFYLNGVQQPLISLAPGATYTFDQSHSSNANHPLRLSTTPGGTHFGGSTYSTGATYFGNPGDAGAYTQIVVPAAIAVTATAISSSIQYPILADVNLVVTAATPTPIRVRSTTVTAATAVTATAIPRAIRGGIISASTAVTANNTILPDPLNYASKDVLSGAIPAANRTASIASASVGPAAIKYVSAAVSVSLSNTAAASRVRSVEATAAIVVSGTAEIGGSLETASASAGVAISAVGGNLLKVKPTSATAAVSASASSAANRVRQVLAAADISVTGTSDRMAYIGMADAAQISVIAGAVPAGATKSASATAATAVTATAIPRKILSATATASAALGANAIATKLTLKIASASAATAVTAAASCVGLKSVSAIAPIVVTGTAAPRAIFGGAATSDILVTATAVSNATIHGLAPSNIAVNGAVIAKIQGDDWGDIISTSEVDPWTTISTTTSEPVNPWTII